MNAKLQKIIKRILVRAVTHPCCNLELLKSRDIDGLIGEGGDVYNWTITAMEADDALKILEEVK